MMTLPVPALPSLPGHRPPVLTAADTPPSLMMLHVAENTVKTHLRHIFQKTGARNQVDLVKLVAGLSSPLAQPRAAPKSG